jgi:hypothetical protein
MECMVCREDKDDFVECSWCGVDICDACVYRTCLPYIDLECGDDIGCWRCYFCRQWSEGLPGSRHNPIDLTGEGTRRNPIIIE